MTTITLDTLKFSRSLQEKAKLTPEQAEGFAVAISEALQGDLVTKTDLKAEIAEAKADIIKWMFGMIGFQTLIILGAVVALVRIVVK